MEALLNFGKMAPEWLRLSIRGTTTPSRRVSERRFVVKSAQFARPKVAEFAIRREGQVLGNAPRIWHWRKPSIRANCRASGLSQNDEEDSFIEDQDGSSSSAAGDATGSLPPSQPTIASWVLRLWKVDWARVIFGLSRHEKPWTVPWTGQTIFQTNEECTSGPNWTLRMLSAMRNSSSTSSACSELSSKSFATTEHSLLPNKYATNLLSWHGASLGSARQELSLMLQGRMCSSLSASRAPIHEKEDQHVESGESDIASGSEMEAFEWEDDEDAEEPEDLENIDDLRNLEAFEDLEEIEEPAAPREPRKSNGRVPDYSMRIEAPIDEIYELLDSRGFITVKQKRPTPNDSVLGQEDHRIVSWYRRVCIGLLNYYSCCDNFLKVKAIVNYQLRWSAIHTLSKKHKSSSRQVIQKYGKNLVVKRDGKALASFLSVEEIKKHQRGFLEIDPVPPETLIDVLYTRMKRRSREEKKIQRGA